MKTIITLQKKQGLFRPRATITVKLEPWECELLSDAGFSFTAPVKVPHHSTEDAICPNGEDHQGYSCSPYIKYDQKTKTWRWEEYLPWKPGRVCIDDYPELEKLARHMQEKVGRILTLAIESVELNESKELPPLEEYKKKAAAFKFAAMAKEDKPCGSAND